MCKSFKGEVLSFVREAGLIHPGDRVIAAASGGADSMALLQLLLEEKESLGISSLEAVHVDHHLRPESGDVAAYVADFCRKKGVLLHTFVSDAPIGHRSEEWSRDFRYGCFEKLAEPGVLIATAHTLSDQAETLLFRLARGTGVRGASGIPAKRGPFIRPMLTVTKQQTEEFCRQRGIRYIMDKDNLTDDYARNRIRHYVIPALETANPKAQAALGSFCERMTGLWQYLSRQGEHLLKTAALSENSYSVSVLLEADPVLRQTALAMLVEQVRARRESDSEQLENILKSGKGRLELGDSTALLAENGCLRFAKKQPQPLPEQPFVPGEYHLPGGYCFTVRLLKGKDCEESIKFAQFHKKALKNCADYDKLSHGLCLRTRNPGDVFRPGGRNVEKSLKKLYNELGIPGEKRNLLPLAAEGSRVFWIFGEGFAHGLRPDEKTRKLLVVQPIMNNTKEIWGYTNEPEQ